MRFSLFTTAVSIFAIAGLAEAVRLDPVVELAEKETKPAANPVAEAAKEAEEKKETEDAAAMVQEKQKQAAIVD